MLNARLVGDHQHGKLLFTWLSLMTSLMVPNCALFSRGMSWMGSGTRLRRFLRVFLSTLHCCLVYPGDEMTFRLCMDSEMDSK